ncbi:calcitonin gene-related peptide type 1 receptor-like isoform X2 [Schistocerca gregaria]|uniref:calcitonin gene-related peptide type 1 receptor-like isoform X2 n=1 Tax=Schistocerca gregaria TaxID=7010 RepID=UPI00211E18B4|nr:calcitonin gene-related peptide type 1 receptor-like isoform X2 [Schistocerca gregaria]
MSTARPSAELLNTATMTPTSTSTLPVTLSPTDAVPESVMVGVNGSFQQDSALEWELVQRRLQCEQRLAASRNVTPAGLFCPGLFDGWSCWFDTPAGVTAHAPCPDFITGFEPNRTAQRHCESNGTWFRHPETGAGWSNYTTCVNLDDLNWRTQVNLVYVAGYSVSLVALIIALAVLSYFKSLRCARNTLHTHLFASFAANNALWLSWYGAVVPRPAVVFANGAGCRLLAAALSYGLLASYTWMLCEGLYLHTLLVAAFVSEARLVRVLAGLGWGLPAAPALAYSVLRATDADPAESGQCWINDSKYLAVLVAPVCITMALNLLFLCNIVRVLLTKLRAGPRVGSSRPSSTLLQALRAALLLVPLLGLHYLLTPFRPEKDHPWEKAYELISAVTASFQGLCVATLFCFCNGEVLAQVKRRWQHLMFRPRANSCTATTVSVRQVSL